MRYVIIIIIIIIIIVVVIIKIVINWIELLLLKCNGITVIITFNFYCYYYYINDIVL
jgi:hypothetical protein